jgi:hypothetical protein
VLFLSACSKTDHVSPSSIVPSLVNAILIERDAVIIVDDYFNYDFLVGSSECKKIVSFSANCGCTSLSLVQGEVLDYSKPFRVNVQLHKSQLGKGSQEFFIKFQDNTAIACRLTYDYIPLPFVTPEELLFFEDINEKELVFCFPSEEDVTILDITLPQGMTWKKNFEKRKKSEIRIVFEINRTIFNDNPMGTINILTSSKKMPSCVLSYLVLR